MAIRLSRNRRTFLLHEDQSEELTEQQQLRATIRQRVYNFVKIGVFLVFWLFFTILISISSPIEPHEVLIPLRSQEEQTVRIEKEPTGDFVRIILKGNVDNLKTSNPSSGREPCIEVCLRQYNTLSNETVWKSRNWNVYVTGSIYDFDTVRNDFKLSAQIQKSRNKQSQSFDSADRSILLWDDPNHQLQVSLLNLYNESTGMSVTIEPNPIDTTQGIIFGFLLLVFLYTLMMLDITDRTFAAILTATAAIGVLSLMNSRPHLETIISWIDVETLMLLFGMMVMVGILSDTGVFDYVSVFAYQLSRGKIWFLIFYLCMFTGFLSAFFDNVSMVLLMVPVTIRLCEILRLNTIFVVISIAIFANIGGTLTPVGDPPNVITATNFFVSANGIHFLNFTLHMFPGVMVSNLLAFLMLYLMGRNNLVATNEAGLLRSIRSLEKQLNSNNQNIRKRIDELKDRLKYEIGENSKNFQETLADMKEKCRIKDKALLIKCCICFGFAICMFLFHSFPFMPGMKICWAAMLGALLLIILADKPNFDSILKRVDWSTLIFFASLFIFVESLVEMGLIDWVGESTISVILSVEKNYQLAVAILLVLWVCALTSAFVDNIPITTMMLKVTINLATNSDLALPLPPLIWALSFGACFGGNGTLIGASANVVTAAIASQYGYTINFYKFFTVGFPIMIMTMIVSTVYLLIAHCAFQWHD